MKADEIRDQYRRTKNLGWHPDTIRAEMQAEIAAQLAESNELKRLEVEAISNLCGTINLLSHEGHPFNKLAGSFESIAVSLDIMVNRGRV